VEGDGDKGGGKGLEVEVEVGGEGGEGGTAGFLFVGGEAAALLLLLLPLFSGATEAARSEFDLRWPAPPGTTRRGAARGGRSRRPRPGALLKRSAGADKDAEVEVDDRGIIAARGPIEIELSVALFSAGYDLLCVFSCSDPVANSCRDRYARTERSREQQRSAFQRERGSEVNWISKSKGKLPLASDFVSGEKKKKKKKGGPAAPSPPPNNKKRKGGRERRREKRRG